MHSTQVAHEFISLKIALRIEDIELQCYRQDNAHMYFI